MHSDLCIALCKDFQVQNLKFELLNLALDFIVVLIAYKSGHPLRSGNSGAERMNECKNTFCDTRYQLLNIEY